MRIALYNQMFGLNGNSFWGNLIGHWAVHFQGNPEKVWKRADIFRTISLVKKVRADVIGLCEIYEGKEEEICKELRKLGYNYFYFGKGHRFKHNKGHVIELLASKFKGKQLNYKIWPFGVGNRNAR